MISGYRIKTGTPFSGKELEELKNFLQHNGLEYDENIAFSIMLVVDEKVVATGSLDRNVMKCISVRPENRGDGLLAIVISELYQECIRRGNAHIFCYTKPDNVEVFKSMGMHSVIETKDILLMENKQGGFKKYLQELKSNTNDFVLNRGIRWNVQADNDTVGAIVANCNPFTKGHRYLIETAANQCSLLHVFVLSTEQGWLTAKERYEMVQIGTEDISNVILHTTSGYLVSPAVFPSYFLKKGTNVSRIQCELDVRIFVKYIAKELSITKRFVGTEPYDKITLGYNEMLKRILPSAGIEVIEVERNKWQEEYISASVVRKGILQNECEYLSMLPDTTIRYLRERGKIPEE